ncbi:MAG: acyltransferase [Methylococcales bacterium]|nr:acyltransferase [Methylococcales bacterium]
MRQLLLLFRDLIKVGYRSYIQLKTRLVIDRQPHTWIDWSARLDVIPLKSAHKRHTLLLKKGAYIETGCVVNTWHGNVTFGVRTNIGINTIVIGPVNIGNQVAIAQNCFISGENHRFDDMKKNIKEQGLLINPIIINNYVWIGANCSVLPGVEIGEHSVIGAGSVVTKHVPAFSLAVGNPAQVIKTYNHTNNSWESLSPDI